MSNFPLQRRILLAIIIATLGVLGIGQAAAMAGTPPPSPPVTSAAGSTKTLTPSAGGNAATAYWWRGFAEHYDQNVYQQNMYVAQTDVNTGYFYINNFRMQNDTTGLGGYMGFQTKVEDCVTHASIGKGFVFSVWNAVGFAGPQGQPCSGTESGQPYKSIHLPFNWTTNNWYAYYASRTWNGSYAKYQVCVSIYEFGSNIWTSVGCILMPVSWSWFLADPTTATQALENYSSPYADCNAIAPSRVVWGASTMHSISAGNMSPGPGENGWIGMTPSGTCTNSASYSISSTDKGSVVGAFK